MGMPILHLKGHEKKGGWRNILHNGLIGGLTPINLKLKAGQLHL
jgi:hypothetical protein